VTKKFPGQINSAVAGYLILRLINPAVATPDFFGIISPTAMSTEIRRALVLLSKMIQNVANNVDFKKEAYMTHFNDYVTSKAPEIASFLLAAAVRFPASRQCRIFRTLPLIYVLMLFRLFRRG
jgi:neurofibromin 1